MAIKITLLLTDKEDVRKLEQAFNEGRLAELGITSLEIEPASETKPVSSWADKERDKQTRSSLDPRRR